MPRQLAPCGTQAAYDRHRARTKRGVPGEQPCELCKAAHRRFNRERYARRQAAQGKPVTSRLPYRTELNHYSLVDIARMIRQRKNLEKTFRIRPDVVRALIHACRQNGLL